MSWLAHYDLGELVQDSVTTCTYLGQRKADAAQVLIKMCKAEYPSARDVLRLRHEYTLLKELGDKGLAGVPRVQGLESHGTGVALILEALPGRALSAVVRETPLDLMTVLHIGSELAGFLDALHHHQVIHKDIKPQNVRPERAGPITDPQRCGVLATATMGQLLALRIEKTGRADAVGREGCASRMQRGVDLQLTQSAQSSSACDSTVLVASSWRSGG